MNLNDYAGTIGLVFRQIAECYDRCYGHDEAMKNITRLLDPDTCAEIIQAAKEQEDEPESDSVQ